MIREEYTYEDMYKSHERELKNTVLNIAISFLKDGIPPETVAENTGLPLEEVKELQIKLAQS